MFYHLNKIKKSIVDWYEKESERVDLQARLYDIQQSEKVSIYHHEQHQKLTKKSSILKLQTEQGIIAGHDACSAFLEGQLADLLLTPAELDLEAQATLLAECDKVFTEQDNDYLIKVLHHSYTKNTGTYLEKLYL